MFWRGAFDQMAMNRPKLGLAAFWHMTKSRKAVSDDISGRCDSLFASSLKKHDKTKRSRIDQQI